jgi:hypothetical protein
MEYIEYEDCLCIDRLTYPERKQELDRIVNSKYKLKEQTTGILILSHMQFTTIGINSIPFEIKHGVNKICYCQKSEFGFSTDLIITSYLLCSLVPVPCKIENTECFIIHPFNHQQNCGQNLVPSLFLTTYFQLFAQGFFNDELKTLVEEGQLPVEVYKKRPKAYVYRAYCEIGDLIHMPSRAYRMDYIVACRDPIEHLYKILG